MSKVRAYAAQITHQVVDQGVSLSTVLPRFIDKVDVKDKALLQHLCYGVLRTLPRLEFCVSQLLDKPLRGKQRVFQFLLYTGVYQLEYMRTADHAAVAETVNALKPMQAIGMKGLVNAVLRNFQRQREALLAKADTIDACKYCHPSWFIKMLKEAYPTQWQDIIAANQLQAPMWLRVNAKQGSVREYMKRLSAADIGFTTTPGFDDGICLTSPMDVAVLPGFNQGAVSVQDAAAQMAARLLDAKDGEQVLDACAAPGGKTCHILERAPKAVVTALDADDTRLQRVTENLQRIGLSAELVCADAAQQGSWHQAEKYDRILLDVPCSATGVIRRHPDIKWLRRGDDIAQLAQLQAEILENVWSTLKVGGTLVYATCSVLPAENQAQVSAFLARHDDAKHIPLHDADTEQTPGLQLLPGDTDGFYYAKLQKQ